MVVTTAVFTVVLVLVYRVYRVAEVVIEVVVHPGAPDKNSKLSPEFKTTLK